MEEEKNETTDSHFGITCNRVIGHGGVRACTNNYTSSSPTARTFADTVSSSNERARAHTTACADERARANPSTRAKRRGSDRRKRQSGENGFAAKIFRHRRF